MTDLATLGLRVETREVEQGERRLDGLANAAVRVDRATDGLTVGMGRANTATGQMAAQVDRAVAGLRGATNAIADMDRRTDALRASVDPLAASMKRTNAEMHEASALYKAGAIGAAEYGRYVDVLENRLASAVAAQNMMNAAQAKGAKSIGLTASESLNLSRQMADVGVSMAMGMSPLMVMIQQGPQIADIFGQASARGVGFSGVLRGMVAAAGPLLPILAGIAAVGGLFAGGFAVATQQMNKAGESADQLQARLGLTDQQMKRVKESGESLSITIGDTFTATMQVAGRAISDALNLDDAWKAIQSGYQSAVDWTMDFARSTVGLIGAAVGGVKAVWALLPAAFGQGMAKAANFVIDIVNAMVDGVVGKINTLIGFLNVGAKIMGLEKVFEPLVATAIPRLNESFATAGQDALTAFVRGAVQGRDGAVAGFNSVIADIVEQARKNRDARLKEEAGDAGKSPKSRMSEAERDFKRAIENATEMVATIKAETAARQSLNDQVARGAITFAEANRALELQARLQPLIIEASKVDGEQRKKLIGLIEQITKAQAALNAEEMRGQMLKASEDRAPQIEMLRKELSLIGETARARAVALAVLKEEQKWREQGVVAGNLSGDSLAAYEAAKASARELATLQVDIHDAQRSYNDALSATADLLADIDARAQDASRGLASAFGDVGRSIGDVLTLMTGYAVQQEKLAVARKLEAGDIAKVAKIDRESARNRVAYYGDLISASKSFFEEGTAGYRLLSGAEQAYRAIQFALAVKAMIMDKTETGATVIQSGIKAAAHGVVAVAKAIASMPFPLNLAAGAATAAALVAFGVKMFGGGSSGGSASGPSISERRQSTQGTGSVLGDASAVSESIANSLDIVASNSNRDLEYSNGMLRALRSIDDQIGAVAAALARSLGAGGALDTSRLKLGTSGTTPSLSNLGFSSSTTKKLVDQGIQFVSQSVADIIAGGIEGATYQAISTSKKKTVFGITLSSSSSTKTTTSALEADLQSQLSLLVGSLRDGVLSAASILGIDGAQATLDAFALNIGKISLKDMTGAEIEEAITAVFGKVADDMAGAVIPGLTALQNVGEGLFETLSRVARQYQVVDTSLKAIGMTFGATGVASLAARERLVDLFGSLDDFADQTAFFAENFLSEAERLAPIQSAVTAELTRLGLAGVTTRDQFKTVVQGLDLSTVAGASLFAALMSVAPAFDKVATASEEAAERLADAQARLAELQLEAADRATEAAISALDAISSAAGETSRAADSALQAAVSATADARQTLVTAYERERKALVDVVGAVDGARAVLTTAYERERNALLDVAAGVDTARANLTTAYERERDALLSVAAGIETAQSALRSAYEAQRQAMVSAYEAQRQAVVQSYEAQRQALTDQLVSVEDARSRLTSAYEAEAGALRGVIDKFGGFAKGLRAFRDELAAGDAAILGPVETLRRRQASFRSMAGSRTDEALGGGIESSGRAYLDAALAGARTSREYQRAVAEVMRAVSVAEVAAKRQADVPTRQLAALDASVAGLLEVQQGVLTVAQGIAGLQSAQQANAAVQAQITALDANHLAALATMDANHAAELAALDTQVGALIDIRDATLSVEAAIAGLAAAQAANATAQGQLAALDASVAGLINVSEGVLSVADALTALTGAQAANATAVQQLAALDASVAGLLAVNDNVISVAQAIAGLQSAQSAAADAQAQIAALDETAAGLGIVNTSVVGVQQAIADLLAAQQAQSVAQATADAATAAYQSASLAAQQAQLAYDADRAAREASAFAAQLAAAQGAVSAAQAAMAPASVIQSPDAPANAPTPTSAAPASTNDNTELVAELRALRAEMTAMKAEQVKTNATTRKMSDLWVRVTRDGEALLTEVA